VADVIHGKSVAMDLEYYEDPKYYDTIRLRNFLIKQRKNSLKQIHIRTIGQPRRPTQGVLE
jgi:hypothetical protein